MGVTMKPLSLFVRSLLALAFVGLASGQASALPRAVATMAHDRAAIALNLSGPISQCVIRHDTDHPAFHGCIDWHSAVHGAWALVAYTRMTGDRQYEPIIRAELTPDNIAQEEAYIVAHPDFEMPYGRSWFLRLAIDYGRTYDDKLLIHMGDVVAQSLFDRYQNQAAQPFSGAYQSDSWALINLMDYYSYRGDLEKLARVKAIVRRDFLVPAPQPCDQSLEHGEFMAICTNVAWAVSKAVDRPQFVAWLAKFLPPSALAGPIVQATSAHENGLNFSRAWGLWGIYAASGERAYARAYGASFKAEYENTQSWDGPYQTVRHWVAQFGMFALSPLFGEEG
jgi:hypothetical protein